MLFALVSLLAVAAASAELGPPVSYLAGPPIEGRIIGGTATDISVVPWQTVIVAYIDEHMAVICGGTILSSFHILAAAHCFPFAPWLPVIWARVGSRFFNSGGTLIPVSRILNHPQYNPDNYDSDISIIFVSPGISIGGPNVATLPLPNPASSLPAGTVVRVSGWGSTSFGGPHSTELMRIDVPVIDWNTCRNRYLELRPYNPDVDVTSNMFCAGLLDVGGKDACDGDSGGPAVAGGVVFGVVSWGSGCAHPHWPGVYAFVPPFTNWIVANAI